MKIIDLTQAAKGREVIVRSVAGGWGIRQRLSQMGIHPDDRLTVKRNGIMSGPVLIHVHGTEVAVGFGMARKVLVSYCDEDEKTTSG